MFSTQLNSDLLIICANLSVIADVKKPTEPSWPVGFFVALVLSRCPIAEIKNYRFQVLALLPQLKKLDFAGVSAKDRESAQTFLKFFGSTL